MAHLSERLSLRWRPLFDQDARRLVGLAPFPSQYLARSLSILISAGDFMGS
jgi:hypothetical protein